MADDMTMTEAEGNTLCYFQQLVFCIYVISFTVFNLWSNFSAWLLLVFHVTYGMMWYLKVMLGYIATSHLDVVSAGNDFVLASLMIYVHWLFPIFPLLIIGIYNTQISILASVGAWLLFVWGIFCQFISDVHFTQFVKHREYLLSVQQQLPPDYASIIAIPEFPAGSFWSIARHPNYFGEVLMFCAFTLCSGSYLPLILILAIVLCLWIPCIQKIEEEQPKIPP